MKHLRNYLPTLALGWNKHKRYILTELPWCLLAGVGLYYVLKNFIVLP